jgi:hypothetical protein
LLECLQERHPDIELAWNDEVALTFAVAHNASKPGYWKDRNLPAAEIVFARLGIEKPLVVSILA